MNRRTLPDFSHELRRPFEVHENCFDCAELYDGCRAWPESRPFACGRARRLPDVQPGACGQMFPPSRVLGCAADGGATPEQKAAREDGLHTDEACEIAKPGPTARGEPISLDRRCGCGRPLPKYKRLCNSCRIQNRRQSKRGYMGAYMRRRRSAPVDADPDLPLFATATHATHARADNLPSTGISGRGCPKNRNFCTNKPHSER